jgi:uncharacterized cupin superfamily protein
MLLILAGHRLVRSDGGDEISFAPGDMIVTSHGGGTWTIAETMHQSFHIDACAPLKG